MEMGTETEMGMEAETETGMEMETGMETETGTEAEMGQDKEMEPYTDAEPQPAVQAEMRQVDSRVQHFAALTTFIMQDLRIPGIMLVTPCIDRWIRPCRTTKHSL